MKKNQLNSPSIAILGAGLLGRLMAWRLLIEGYKIYLLEAKSFTASRAAGFTAAGMISPLSELASCDKTIYNLGKQSLNLWPQWVNSLNTNKPLFFSNGSIAVAHPQDQVELAQFHREISTKLAGDAAPLACLSQSELTKLEPQLSHFTQGIFLADEAHIDNRNFLTLLLARIRKLGGVCIENCLIELENGELCEQSNSQLKKYAIPYSNFDHIIDCRGMGAKNQATPLRGVRGEVLWVESKEIHFKRPIRLMHPRYKLYVVPKPNQQFIIGATEIESADLSPISLQSTLELSSALYTLHPAFAEARLIATDTNLRPAYADNQPKILQSKKYMSINGLYRHGYLIAPALVSEAIEKLKVMFEKNKSQNLERSQ